MKEKRLTRFRFHLLHLQATAFLLHLLGCLELFVLFLKGKSCSGQKSHFLNAVTIIKVSNYFYWNFFSFTSICASTPTCTHTQSYIGIRFSNKHNNYLCTHRQHLCIRINTIRHQHISGSIQTHTTPVWKLHEHMFMQPLAYTATWLPADTQACTGTQCMCSATLISTTITYACLHICTATCTHLMQS